MAFNDRLCGSDELVVERFEALLRIILKLRQRAGLRAGEVLVLHEAEPVQSAHGRIQDRDIDLVEGQPVFDLVLVALKAGHRVFHKEVDHAAVRKSVVLRDDRPRNLIVAERDQRLDAVLFAFVEHPVVKCKAFLIRLGIIPVREDTRPVDRHAVAFEAHLAEERDVFLIVMIQVDRLVGGIENAGLRVRAERSRGVHVAAEQHIRHGESLSAFKIGAFALICGCRAAP